VADAAHVAVKTEMLQLRLMEKKRELVRQADVDALIDGIVGVTLTHLSSMPARCAPRESDQTVPDFWGLRPINPIVSQLALVHLFAKSLRVLFHSLASKSISTT
jgi:hypothetical protein